MRKSVLWGSVIATSVGLPCAAQIEDPIPDPIEKGDIRIGLREITTGLFAPNLLTHAGDGSGRMFVVDQPGQIHIIRNGQRLPTPFLDVSDRIVELGVFGSQDENDFDERGLLGLAFHPGFADRNSPGFGRLYTYTSEAYDADLTTFTTTEGPPQDEQFDHQSVITEWSIDLNNHDSVDPSSRRELLRIDQPQFNHNAGSLNFGPDGMLHIAVGDGGGADDQNGTPWFGGGETWGHGPDGNAQDTQSVHGSILRIDPLGTDSSNGRYGIPGDNPFVNSSELDEILAYGLRNPFRMSFDTQTGELIAADVGQNDIEEVNIIQSGGNYGWRVKEGTFLFDPNGSAPGFVFQDSPGDPPGMTDPVVQYDHDEGISVIGGFVYRGSFIPELFGKYVFGDFSTDFGLADGRLFYADLDTGEIREFLLGSSDLPLGMFVKGFGQDAAGELYLMAGSSGGPFVADGTVFRIVPGPGPLATLGLGFALALRRRR